MSIIETAISQTNHSSQLSMGEDSGLRLRDRFGRAITDLRVSITDRCNYRCVHCRDGASDAGHCELSIADYTCMIRLMVVRNIDVSCLDY